jgi:P4 family phage/plasmid primase-like protien
MTEPVFELFFAPGEAAEIRAIGCKRTSPAWAGFCGGNGTVSGYFDNAADFARCADAVDAAGAKGVYFTLNPVNPDLVARAANRLKASPKSTTADKDIVCLRWLYVDLDPQRPAEISASDTELAKARTTAQAIVGWLEGEMGFSRAIRAKSGNGFHLLYRLPDLAPSDDNRELIRRCLKALAHRFPADDTKIKVDETTFNPARICKLYGTMARKGDSTSNRPHRQSALMPGGPQTLSEVSVTGIDSIKKLADLAPADEGKHPSPPVGAHPTPGPSSTLGRAAVPAKKTGSKLGPMNMRAYLDHYGVEVIKEKSRDNGILYCLAHCVFDPSHEKEAGIWQGPNRPYMTYQCFHDSCRGKTWKDAKHQISGSDSLAPFCEGYDPNWRQRHDENPVRTCRIEQSENHPDVPSPAPETVDPMVFFEPGTKGRPKFVPLYMANYLYQLFCPLVYTDGEFYRYDAGVWRVFPRSAIYAAGVRAMDVLGEPEFVERGIRLLVGHINKEAHQWEDCQGYINCVSGMIDLTRLRDNIEDCLLPHDPRYGSRVQVPCTFNPDSLWDRWARFLLEIFPDDGNEENIKKGTGFPKQTVLQQFFGYCLLADCRYDKALFLYGTGANGKSTAMGVLEDVVGRDNVSTLSIGDLGQRFNTQFLQNKLVNIATETSSRDPLSTEIFKAAVAGDPIKAERKYGEPYQFRPYAKFVMAMNDTPVIPDKSYGFERRIIILDFPRRFEEDEMDPCLSAKLQAERDGIFFWSLLGLQELLAHDGFAMPQQVADEKRKWLQGLYPLLSFVDECLEMGPAGDADYTSHPQTTYDAYKRWCHSGGNRPLSRNKFYDQLMMNFPHIKKKPIGERRLPHFLGVRVIMSLEQPDPAPDGARRRDKILKALETALTD